MIKNSLALELMIYINIPHSPENKIGQRPFIDFTVKSIDTQFNCIRVYNIFDEKLLTGYLVEPETKQKKEAGGS